ncbi:MAG: hypothetical protein ABI995_01880 [Acidobacteriota bacterium]
MSKKRSQASRINGAKSKGSTTPNGKARSSQSALKHGLNSKTILIPGESQKDFDDFRDAVVHQLQPRTQLEMEIVESMAANRWRLRRVPSLEANMLINEINHRVHYQDNVRDMEDENRLAYAFDSLNKELALLIRYQSSLERNYLKAYKHLQELQLQELPNEPEELPDPRESVSIRGPIPASDHPETPLPDPQTNPHLPESRKM